MYNIYYIYIYVVGKLHQLTFIDWYSFCLAIHTNNLLCTI